METFDFFSGNDISYFVKDVVFKHDYPLMNIYGKNSKYKITALMPGVKKNQIEVYYKNGYLILRGFKKDPDNEKADFVRAERGFGPFLRSVKISKKIDTGSIVLKATNGVFEINFNVIDNGKAKDIKVK